MSAAEQIQTFLGKPTFKPDETSPESELDSRYIHHSIYSNCKLYYSMNVPDPKNSIKLSLNSIFLRNGCRCNCEHGSWFFDKDGNMHNCGFPLSGYCKGLIIKPSVKCKIINQNKKFYLRLEFNFKFENFGERPDFDRKIEEYNRMCKIILVEIDDYRIIELGSLKLLLNNMILAEPNEDVEENKVGETCILIEYNIRQCNGTIVKYSLPVLSINYLDAFGGSSFPNPLGVNVIES